MFQRSKNFVKNHWKKLVFGGVAVQVAAYGVRYAANKFLSYQEEQAIQYWQKVKKQQYFENVDQNCITTFHQLYDVMKAKVGDVFNAELIQEQLKSNLVKNKLEAWEELKIIAFSRIIVTVYGSSLLYIFIRIQLSMIGGYLIKVSKTEENPSAETEEFGRSSPKQAAEEAQRKFLDLAQYFSTTGIVKICDYVHERVKAVVAPISLKQTFSSSDLEQLFWAIIRKVMSADEISEGQQVYGSPTKYPWKYVLPDELLNNYDFFNGKLLEADPVTLPTVYRKLITETYDLLEADDTKDVLRFFESQGVSYFTDTISECIRENTQESPSTEKDANNVFVEPRVVLAKLIPTMTSLHLVNISEDPWINLLTHAESVKVLSANIYEAFCSE